MHVAALQDSNGGVCGKVGLANKKIKVNGWAREVSLFWGLLWMRTLFYNCFSICLLHIEHLGLLKVHS